MRKEGSIWRLLARLGDLGGTRLTAIGLQLLCSVLQVVSSLYLARLTDAAGSGISAIWRPMAILGAIFAVAFPLEMVGRRLEGRAAARFTEKLRLRMGRALTDAPLPAIEGLSSGDTLSRSMNDVNSVSAFSLTVFPQLYLRAFRLLLALALAFYISWELTVTTFAVLPVMLLLSFLASKPLERVSAKRREALSRVGERAQDAVGTLKEIKSYTLEEPMEARYGEALNGLVAASDREVRRQALLWPLTMANVILPISAVVLLGGAGVMEGRLSFGLLLGFIQNANNIINPLMEFGNFLREIRAADAAAKRLWAILTMPAEPAGGAGAAILEKGDAAIALKDVRFAYEGQPELFSGVNLTVGRGQTAAVVGASGCGKSTVLKLISALYRPSGGEVAIFGRAVDDWSLKALREQMALVSQESYLFPGTLRDNLLLGREGAGEAEMLRALADADLGDFVAALPEGLDTVVGERGARLSGGQRQRVAIARAFLKDAPILLLDEPTSALDAEAESAVQRSLDRLMRNRATVVVAHRLKTIRQADVIYCLRDGAVCESGTHEELFRRGGAYAALYEAQHRMEEEAS